MKYRVSQYAEALAAATEGKSEVAQKMIVKRFTALLARHRVIGKARMICAAYEKIVLQKKGMRSVRIETASPASEKIKKEIHAMLGKNIHIEAITNPDVLGGITIVVDDEILIDASVRRQMDRMYKNSPSVIPAKAGIQSTQT